MKNKIEFKKTMLLSCIVIIVVSAIFQFYLLYQYKVYTGNFNKKIGMIVTNVQNQYPNIDKNELIQILNNQEDVETGLLKQYGINLENDSIIIQNDKMFVKFSIINLCFIIGLAMAVLLIFVKYTNSKDKKLGEITKYIEEINNKNYKLDIEDNTEDELSILKNEVYKTRNDFIKDIRRELVNINFLVNSLLKLSKLDANSVHFIKKQVCVQEIINNAIKNVSILCDLKNINILVEENKNIKINCDFKWQVEALTNIIKNCIEHSKDNSKIEIHYEENSVYTKIEIKDHGIGINKQDLPHIFERFYKGKNSSNESNGIGLALAKSIIESNNGYIDVESEVGIGSLFIIKYFK